MYDICYIYKVSPLLTLQTRYKALCASFISKGNGISLSSICICSLDPSQLCPKWLYLLQDGLRWSCLNEQWSNSISFSKEYQQLAFSLLTNYLLLFLQTTEHFLEMFRNNLLDVKIDPVPYSIHSFCCGGCQWMSVQLCWPLYHICRWGLEHRILTYDHCQILHFLE